MATQPNTFRSGIVKSKSGHYTVWVRVTGPGNSESLSDGTQYTPTFERRCQKLPSLSRAQFVQGNLKAALPGVRTLEEFRAVFTEACCGY